MRRETGRVIRSFIKMLDLWEEKMQRESKSIVAF